MDPVLGGVIAIVVLIGYSESQMYLLLSVTWTVNPAFTKVKLVPAASCPIDIART